MQKSRSYDPTKVLRRDAWGLSTVPVGSRFVTQSKLSADTKRVHYRYICHVMRLA
jgi:hypothetical protein